MPTGYSFNLDGTTLYLAMASVFVAQAAATTIPGFTFTFEHETVAIAHVKLEVDGFSHVNMQCKKPAFCCQMHAPVLCC